MLSSEITNLLQKVPQVYCFFRGIFTIDTIPTLEEDEFIIINTE